MPVKSIGPYQFPAANREENYGGDWNIYVDWAQHLMFTCPNAYRIPPDMRLRDFLEQVMRPEVAAHPDTAQLDFARVEWTYEGKPWQPDLDLTLRENGLRHMAFLRFRSPGLDGLDGTGN